MTNKEQNDRIEQYLLKNMKDNEREAFEDELNSDPDLKKITEKKQLIIRGIKAGFNAELKLKLKREDQQLKRMVKTRRIKYISGIAAVLIIGVFSTFFLNSVKQDPIKIYEKYYHAYPNISIPLSRSDKNTDNPYYFYETGNFQAALTGLKALIDDKPGDEAALFYAAIIYMELADFENAIEYLKRVTSDNPNRFTRPANWYLSLAYIHSDNLETAAKYLDKLAGKNDVYGKNSKKILKKLN